MRGINGLTEEGEEGSKVCGGCEIRPLIAKSIFDCRKNNRGLYVDSISSHTIWKYRVNSSPICDCFIFFSGCYKKIVDPHLHDADFAILAILSYPISPAGSPSCRN